MRRCRDILIAGLAAGSLVTAAACYPSGNESTTTSSADSAPPTGAAAHGQPAFRANPECGTYDGEGCAPQTDRIDTRRPTFSNPTKITNPLFPISELESVVFLGTVDGLPFRSETTLLSDSEVVMIDGKPVEALVSQYVAYADGRITEVARDRYAQADDGAVWYLGEDVYDYEAGTVNVSEGTWLAGRDGPPAMIMPGHPKVGQVFRPEDIPGIVFEEVTIKEVGKTVDGPFGQVHGAVVAEELHLDGSTSDKTFAPGFGEFYTANENEIEALSLAVPANRKPGRESVTLAQLVTAAWGMVESARLEEWEAADSTLDRITRDWDRVGSDAPERIADSLEVRLAQLTSAVHERTVAAVTSSAADVAELALDLELRSRSVAFVDIERFHLHAQRLRIAAAAADTGGVAAEIATLERIRDRINATFTPKESQQVDDALAGLRLSADNLPSAADQAAWLANLVRRYSAS